MLRLFVRRARFDEDQAAGMLAWPHSGFHVHTAVWVPEDDRTFATRLARDCARNPVALERLTYDRAAEVVTYGSDKAEGPTAGTETADALEFLARVLTHIPDQGQVTTRYYGWYANRPRGMRRRPAAAGADPPVPVVVAPRLAPTEATRRWAALLRQLFEVDPLVCPHGAGPMRIVACITQAADPDAPAQPRRRRGCGRSDRGAQPARDRRVRGTSPAATTEREPRTAPRALRVLTVAPSGAGRSTRDTGRRPTDGRPTPRGPHQG